MIWLVLTNSGVYWSENKDQAMEMCAAHKGVVVSLPVLFDYRYHPPVCMNNGDAVCFDEIHCASFGCLKFNADGSIKDIRQSRHSIWNG